MKLRAMKDLLFISTLILTFCGGAFAQTNETLPCPTIDVLGPVDVTSFDEPVIFNAKVNQQAPKLNLKYSWSVQNGEIIQGQGTLTIKVLQKDFGVSLTATLEITGLPKECAVTASASAPMCECIGFFQMDEFSIAVSQIDKARLDNLTILLNNNPNANAYIVERFKKKTSRKAIAQKNKIIAGYLKGNGIETGRFVLLNALALENSTQFFIVPAGATPPTCEDCTIIELK